MKNVAIITLPLANYNYGGILQAFALQKFLRDNFDVNAMHIDRHYERSLKERLKIALYNILYASSVKKRLEYFSPLSRFVQENIILSKPITNRRALIHWLRKNNIDTIITGSDQVWRKSYAHNILNDLLLDIPYSCKKLSYAASFGTDDYKDPLLSKYIARLDGISLREAEACEYLTEIGIPALHHLDPTMLLSQSVYSSLAELSNKPSKGKIGVYILDTDTKLQARIGELGRKLNKELNYVGQKVKIGKTRPHKHVSAIDSIEDWLRTFRDSDYIITDSFHGCVFSILFNKQFVTVGNASRGLSRFYSLLATFGLRQRLVTIEDSFDELFVPIDYERINMVINTKRKEALEYLSKHII